MLHTADRVLFATLHRHARDVPVVIIRTMTDIFMSDHKEKARRRIKQDLAFQEETLEKCQKIDNLVITEAEKDLQNRRLQDIEEVEKELGLDKEFALFVYVSSGMRVHTVPIKMRC